MGFFISRLYVVEFLLVRLLVKWECLTVNIYWVFLLFMGSDSGGGKRFSRASNGDGWGRRVRVSDDGGEGVDFCLKMG